MASLGVPVLPMVGPVGNSYTTKEGIKISVIEGNIEKAKVIILVEIRLRNIEEAPLNYRKDDAIVCHRF